MPNRKKAAGKARKEKAKGGMEMFDPMRGKACRHGAEPLAFGDLSQLFLKKFMDGVDATFNELMRDKWSKGLNGDNAAFVRSVTKAAEDAKAKFPTVMTDHVQRQHARAHIFAIATKAMLRQGSSTEMNETYSMAFTTAAMSLTVFEVDEKDTFGRGQPVMMCGERDLVKFLHHRIPCKCLEARHKQLRKQPSLAPCFHCGVMTERKKLLLCSKCRCDNYCSRECQVAAWPQHKLSCKDGKGVHLKVKECAY